MRIHTTNPCVLVHPVPCELIGPGPVLTLPPPFLQRWEDLGEQVWCLCTWYPEVVRETDKGESTWQRARELAPAHGERAPAPRGGSDARGRNHGSHIDSPARVFVSDESSPCGTRKLALRSPVRADFSLVPTVSSRGAELARYFMGLIIISSTWHGFHHTLRGFQNRRGIGTAGTGNCPL